jgi:hypothetical protein
MWICAGMTVKSEKFPKGTNIFTKNSKMNDGSSWMNKNLDNKPEDKNVATLSFQ